MTDQPGFEPPHQQSPRQQPVGQPPQPVPPVKKTTGSPALLAGIIAGVLGLGIGSAVGAAGGSGTTAAPESTVTVTETADAPTRKPPTSKPTSLPKPTKKPPPTATTVTSRQWAKIVKSPDDYIGKRYIIYGEVTQFDSATGDDSFLADTAHKNTTDYGYFEGKNTKLNGDAGKLSDVVENDVFKATVTVLGSYSYDTQIGGNTTVPELQINKIKVIGHNS
jgi:hypothetical protein